MAPPPLLKSVRDITRVLARYPIKNQRWAFSTETGEFAAEASEVSAQRGTTKVVLDPWNRPLAQTHCWVACYAGPGEDSELTRWEVTSSVAGVPIPLVVFND